MSGGYADVNLSRLKTGAMTRSLQSGHWQLSQFGQYRVSTSDCLRHYSLKALSQRQCAGWTSHAVRLKAN